MKKFLVVAIAVLSLIFTNLTNFNKASAEEISGAVDTSTWEEIVPEVGELAVGNWYRIYRRPASTCWTGNHLKISASNEENTGDLKQVYYFATEETEDIIAMVSFSYSSSGFSVATFISEETYIDVLIEEVSITFFQQTGPDTYNTYHVHVTKESSVLSFGENVFRLVDPNGEDESGSDEESAPNESDKESNSETESLPNASEESVPDESNEESISKESEKSKESVNVVVIKKDYRDYRLELASITSFLASNFLITVILLLIVKKIKKGK